MQQHFGKSTKKPDRMEITLPGFLLISLLLSDD